MKKTLLSLLALCAGFAVFAQRVEPGTTKPTSSLTRAHATSLMSRNNNLTAAKTTYVNTADTFYLYNNYDSLLFDSSALYAYGVNSPADSGYVFGTNAYGDNGFAEYFYGGYGADTSIDIIGVYSDWGGTVNPNSTNSITFNLWTIDTSLNQLSQNSYLTGLPGSIFASSQSVPLTALNLNNPAAGTLTFFTNPIPNLQRDFFLGYTITYSPIALNGDLIGLRSTPDGTGYGPGAYSIDNQGDTIIFSQNAILNSGQWYDSYEYLYKDVNLSLLPIYLIDPTTSVKGVTRSNLTVFGCAPNPSVNSTNINFSLQQNADVTIQVLDATGRVMTTVQQPGLATGTHVVNISTESWPAGNYVYIARTSTGAAIASQLTVIK
ncbi:MAG: T9SS type A sorting domain-containing protein [Flavipsychrobacter sp.]|nr:T9SS type A sorting domain-containing protein [Flavipsychrobacter sp.]